MICIIKDDKMFKVLKVVNNTIIASSYWETILSHLDLSEGGNLNDDYSEYLDNWKRISSDFTFVEYQTNSLEEATKTFYQEHPELFI